MGGALALRLSRIVGLGAAGFVLATIMLGRGSLTAGSALLRSEVLQVESSNMDFGDVAPDTTVRREIVIYNYSGSGIEIAAGSADCSCVVLAELPVTIQARSQYCLPVQIRVGREKGSFRRSVWLTGPDDRRLLTVNVRGRVVANVP
jgi:hypothetical protein